MYCSECGSTLGLSDKFCSKCGAAISAIHEQLTQEAPPHITPTVKLVNATSISTSFRDPSQLTRWLLYFLYASIAIDFIALFSGVLQYQLLSDFKLGIYSSEALATPAAEANDQRQKLVGLFQVGIAITTIILFAMWIYRANFNARSLGAQNMEFTPGWSVGYYFIPLLNFWRPYQAMKEIWKASKNPTSWEGEERGAILPWWWFFFLIAGIFGNASFRTTMSAKEIHELITSTEITIASDIVSILATFISLVLVKKIYGMQLANAQRQTEHSHQDGQFANKASHDVKKKLRELFGKSGAIFFVLIVAFIVIIGLMIAFAVPIKNDYIVRSKIVESQKSNAGQNINSPRVEDLSPVPLNAASVAHSAIDEFADMVILQQGFDPAEVRRRGYDSFEILERSGYKYIGGDRNSIASWRPKIAKTSAK